MTRNEWTAAAAAVAVGIGVFEFSVLSTGPLEVDWDRFHTAGLMLISLAAGILGYIEPRQAWRWGFLPIAAVPAWILIRSGTLGDHWPFFLIAFMSLAIPPMIAGWIGAWLNRRRAPA